MTLAHPPRDDEKTSRRKWLRRLSSPEPWLPDQRKQLAVVAFSHAVQHSYVAVLGIVYPFALAEFGANYAELGVVLGVAGLAGGLLQGMASLIKRGTTRAYLSAQNLGIAIVSALGAVAPGLAWFGAARVMGSLVAWPQHPMGAAHVTEHLPRRRGFALAVHTTGGNLGTLVAPLAASALLSAFGWRWALGGPAILMALASLVTWRHIDPMPAAPSPHSETPRDQSDNRAVSAGGNVSLRRALRRRDALAVLVAGTISAAGRGVGVLATYIPAYLHSGLHKPAVLVGALTTVVSVGAMVGPMVTGALSDRTDRRRVLYVVYGVGSLSLLAFAMVGGSVAGLGVIGLAVGIFSFSEQPLRQALFSEAMNGVPARRVFGAYFAVSQSIGALWITVLGVIVTVAGFHTALITMALSFVAAGLIIAFGVSSKTTTTHQS